MIEPSTKVDFVTVGWHNNSWSAWMLRNKLAEEGIDAFVQDEFAPTANWLYGRAIGFVKVEVPYKQMELAHKVIARDDSQVFSSLPKRDPDVDEPTCSSCGSSEIYKEWVNVRMFFLVLMILGMPIPFFSSATECFDCGHRSGPPTSFRCHGLWLLFIATFVVFAYGFILSFGVSWLHLATTP